ncbi:MAG TPA: vWA domain-containing protein, partial [Bryobacteraceae bacterium]
MRLNQQKDVAMRRRFQMIVMCAAVAVCVLGMAQTPAVQARSLHAGPLYTSSTEFPKVRVLVDVPPETAKASLDPASFALQGDNGTGAASPGTQVQTLAETGYGMAAVVMLDVSGSMLGGPLNAIRAGLVKFASQVGLQDRAAIATVADETKWETNWNDSPDQVKAALAGLKSRGTLTRLWDGLLEVLGKYPETPIARRLIVISDGHDEGSRHTLGEVIAEAGKQHVVIDSIGMTRSDPKYLLNLAQLSTSTGGSHRAATSLPNLEKLVGDGIERYRNLPVVTFQAAGATADGKSHPFLLTW